MENLSEKVTRVFTSCLFTDEEVDSMKEEDLSASASAVIAEGIQVRVGFNKERILKFKSEIESIVLMMDPTFKKGWTFLNLCNDKDGKLWTGDHRVTEQLVMLAIAAGVCEYTAPRNMWQSFPGGMPYIRFMVEDKRCDTCRLHGTCPFMIFGREDRKEYPSIGCDKWQKKENIAG